jgi:hypothetical protein
MTTQTLRNIPIGKVGIAEAFLGLLDDLAAALEAISAGGRAAHDWNRLRARRNGMSRGEIAREVFERNFA